MNRIYHITFKMEGPKAEVLRLTRLLHRITAWRGELFDWLRRHPDVSGKSRGPLSEIATTLQSNVTNRSVEALSDGWQVLTLEVLQEYPEAFANTYFWELLQQRFLPDGTCYYRVTDIEHRRICTNDVYGKYFPETYMLCVLHDAGWKNDELDSIRRELLQDKYRCCGRKGQTMYLSYWDVNSLRWVLCEILGLRRRVPIDERRVLWQKAWEWATDFGFTLIWGIVERRAPEKLLPCRHCRKIRDLQAENEQLRGEIAVLRQRVRNEIHKLQRKAEESLNPSPKLICELEKGQQALRRLDDFSA
ncbi:hypothetical protein [Mitsuokella sp. WILCCON 0060]|uniref:hypothetical protein n=1 Tax=Mitsuokella sp. WILCCON 0060 TaxID=3345341 RepID=UPI003F1C698D